MDSKRLKQVVRQLEKSLSSWDFDKAIKASNDETTTRDFIIHPFFDLLGYQRIDDFTHEYIADVGGKRGRRVDIAVTLGKGNPQFIVECKKVGTSFSDNHFRQLNEYIHYTPSADIGILTNGVRYDFYLRNNDSTTGLHNAPFFSFDLSDFDRGDLETLALFYRPTISVASILEEAGEIMFLNKFDKALADVLSEKTDGFVKDVCRQMGVQRVSEKLKGQVSDLINSISLRSAVELVSQNESDSRSSGIITTEEELRSYNIIRTVLAMSSKIKNDQMARITYRDYKSLFKVLVDDNQQKTIATLELNSSKKKIWIEDICYDLEDTSAVSITKFKRELIEAAIVALG